MAEINWHKIKSNDSQKNLFFFLIVPSIFIAGLLILSNHFVKPSKYQLIFLLIYLVFSFPHFAISFTQAHLKKNYLDIINSKSIFVFLSCLASGVWLFFTLPEDKLLLIFIPMSAYQSWHYSLQNYGISYYFIKEEKIKNILKLVSLGIGLLFLSNFLTVIFENTGIDVTNIFPIIIGFLKITLLISCLMIVGKFSKNAYLSDKKSIWGFVNLFVWLFWAWFSSNFIMILALPVLHSIQYLPFIYKKARSSNISLSKLIGEYLIGLILISALYYLITIIADLSLQKVVMKYFLSFALIINSIHIFIDSFIWRRN